MSKASLETAIRNDILAAITETLTNLYETDVMPVSASELTIPVLDAEGNEKYALIKVSIPRGTRVDGGYKPYDGYGAAEEWKETLADRKNKKDAREEKKAREEKEKERKRNARKVVKQLNDVGFKALVAQPMENPATQNEEA